MAAERIGAPANISDRMRAYGVPGVSIAVVENGRIAWAKGYGIADSATARPVTAETLFQAASISEILQQLVTDVSGRPFEEYMQSEVLKPIGMTNSTFMQPLPESLRSIVATGHYAGGLAVPGRFRVSPELTRAGLWSTPTDIARYIISVQKSYGGSVEKPLRASVAAEMLSPGLGSRAWDPPSVAPVNQFVSVMTDSTRASSPRSRPTSTRDAARW